jgi:hypothetical protein
VEGLTVLIAETKAGGRSFAALYGAVGTPVSAMRLVDLGKPADSTSLSLGIDNDISLGFDNDIAALTLVVPAPSVTRVRIQAGIVSEGQPIMADVPASAGPHRPWTAARVTEWREGGTGRGPATDRRAGKRVQDRPTAMELAKAAMPQKDGSQRAG